MYKSDSSKRSLADKKISRSSLIGSLGALGALGTLPFLVTSCGKNKLEQVVYEGSHQEAILDNILKRRSIRKYTDQEVSQEILDVIMRCAIFAPSATNEQPWEVRVIHKPELLTIINERWKKTAPKKNLIDAQNPNYSVMHHAPVLVVIAGDVKNPKARVDVGIMLQTILLSSHALGLGSCPIGMLVPTLIHPENQDIVKTLNIPDGYEVMANIALGYPDESPEAPIRFSDKVKFIK